MSTRLYGVSFALLVFAGVSLADAVKWPFRLPEQFSKKQVNRGFDDESVSFWASFKTKGFNASATIIPIAEEIRNQAPGYLAYASLSTGIGLFLPPKATTATNIAYVATAVARSHEDVETFCKDEGRALLANPSLHLALISTALRTLRFRVWRGLLVKATLFRLRYQLRFMRLYRPRWLTAADSPLEVIVQDTVQAARSVQGLFPDLCQQAALVAGGCQLAYWSECNPPRHVEKGWTVNRNLDRRLKREFGKRARRVRPGDDYPLGPGLLGWRIPHRLVLRVTRVLRAPAYHDDINKKRPLRRPGRSRNEEPKSEELAQVVEILEEDVEHEGGTIVELMDETTDAFESEEEGAPSDMQQEGPVASNGVGSTTIPAESPLIRFHNVTAIASRGSTLTKSYRALAELPYREEDGKPDEDAKSKRASASYAPDPEDELAVDTDKASAVLMTPARQPPALQPVVIKRNLPRQLFLAEDDVAAARKALRQMTFKAKIDLHLSGVVSEVEAAVARAGDLRSEAESIERIRRNLKRAGMLGSTIVVPEVVSCPELGPLARPGILVTTALRGVEVADAYVMGHAAAPGEKERNRFLDSVFAAFGQMCLADGCFPSNPMLGNLLYMYSGQVGLTDLSSVIELTEEQRRALCRLYRTMAEIKGEDAANPSAAAEMKARAAMEGIGLVIDLPPAGGIPWVSPPSSEQDRVSSSATVAVETMIGASLGNGAGDAEEGGEEQENGVGEELVGEEVVTKDREREGEETKTTEGREDSLLAPSQSRSRAPLTHVMLLRGLFDTQREEALALLGGGGGQLLTGMAVRRLPQAVAPVLRMVANLRGVCAHLDMDKSLLPRFSRAAAKGLSWRLTLVGGRGGGNEEGSTGEAGSPQRLPYVVHEIEESLHTRAG